MVANTLTSTEGTGHGFAKAVCSPLLAAAQNADGGWGYRPGAASAVEATAWSLLGLQKLGAGGEAIERGRHWLLGTQGADGSWPTRAQTHEGNWLTALAGLALLALDGPLPAVAKAAGWVCRSRSAEGGLRARLVGLLSRKKVVDQDFALRGWSWTPGTSSWVEPTSIALIFLHCLPAEIAPEGLDERRRMGEAMLYDRMCPGGGWNFGNPKVYGVAGTPKIGPTAWALLALQEHTEREENRRSLDWLAARYDSIAGLNSLSLAKLALDAGGRAVPDLERRLSERHAAAGFLSSVMAYAQAAFALGERPDVLRWQMGKA